jgi:hypothetical protein
VRHVLVGTTLSALALTASLASAEVRLTIAGGEVSLSAQNATISQILAEWARGGKTRIVNGERVPGGPVTIELSHMPEQRALEILLRTAGGYLLAPRAIPNTAASKYDRILIVPVSSPPSGARPPVQTAATPTFQPARPAFTPAPIDHSDDAQMPGQPGPPRPPSFSPFPQGPQPAQPSIPGSDAVPQPAPSEAKPVQPFGGGATGVKFPGMAVPTPAPGARGTNPGAPQ